MQAELANKAGSTTYMAAPSAARTRPRYAITRLLGVKVAYLPLLNKTELVSNNEEYICSYIFVNIENITKSCFESLVSIKPGFI